MVITVYVIIQVYSKKEEAYNTDDPAFQIFVIAAL
jgi:hypothetical protein